MAGTEVIYQCKFYDYCGNLITAQILQDGYAGSTTEVEGSGTSCQVSYMGEGEDKFTHIKASECRLELVSSTSLQYLDLFLNPTKTYRVYVARGADSIWYGWINQEYFTEPFLPPKYITSISATDGLAELKNKPFPIPGYGANDFKQTFIYYISTCLQQIGDLTGTGSYLGIAFVSNLVAETITDGVISSRLLENLYLDYRSLRDENGDFISCYDVLNEILATLNARIYQHYGHWRIERIDIKHDDHTVEYYDGSGTYVQSLTEDAIVELTSHVGKGTDIRFINMPAMLEVQPAYKQFTIKQEYGRRLNILPFTSFTGKFIYDEFSSTSALRYWTASGSATVNYESRWDAVRIGGYWPTESGLSSKYLDSDEIAIEDEGITGTLDSLMTAWATGEVIMKFEFTVAAELEAITYTALTMDFSGNAYTLQESVSGSSGDATLLSGSFNVDVSVSRAQWKTITLTVRTPPEDEIGVSQTSITASVRIYQGIYESLTTGGVMYKDIKLWFENGIKSTTDITVDEQDKGYERELTTVIDVNNILEPDEYMMTYGNTWPFEGGGAISALQGFGPGLLHKKIIFDSGGIAVNHFGTSADHTNSYLIDFVIVNDLNACYIRPQFKLKGSIIDTTIATLTNFGVCFNTILKDYNSRYYCPTGLTIDLKQCTMTGEWLQMWDDATGEFSDDFSEDFFI